MKMFSGLIEEICLIRSVQRAIGSMVLTIDLGRLAGECKSGDSIAVNGACLTIGKLQENLASFDVSPETMNKTSLGRLKPSSPVNIERAMKPSDRFGGHFVQGHVDGTAIIRTIDQQGDYKKMTFFADNELLDGMIVKGSVAVDGVSLTISKLDRNSFSVALIPQTLKRTTLGTAKIGDYANIENDIIIKTVKKRLDEILPKAQPLTADKLRQMGF
jgi:riboflavin synthase